MPAAILVVDDDPRIRELVSDLLGMEGFDVETATNGADALRLLELTTPRLVILDMRMPILNGWGFARALKGRHHGLPLLVMSGAVDVRRCAAEIGADGYVSKPFDLDDLLAEIERLLLLGPARGTPTCLPPLSAGRVHATSAGGCSDLTARRRH